MRAYNERLVLSLVRRHGALAKMEIARMTGLSAQTVSVIMRALEADGLLLRGKPVRGKVGQPAVPMSLDPQGALFFGLKIGRRSSDLVLIDFLGQVMAKVHSAYRYPTPAATIAFAREALTQITAQLTARQNGRIAGLGIAMPFQLWDWAEFVEAPSDAMMDWKTVDIRAEIAEGADYPVFLLNDASAACGAELVFGSAPGQSDFLYFYIGYFIGGGVVLNGSLYSGRTGNAGAIGSMPVPDGRGGTGQLIDIASIATLEAALDAAGHASSVLWESPGHWPVDESILGEWIDGLSKALAHAIVASSSVIDFEAAVIDGWLPSEVRARIVAATRVQIEQIDLAGIRAPIVREGTVGHDARALGAASLALSQRFLVDSNAFLMDQ
ncbi:ROK family transcriptional regulator [Mesorhizobium xinjiangense]|uniref:ROK family transcriptional regulator n=1 Tax=Mesorhizobium xinjiangense TaxID=2678685 RepID=UPI0018DE711A|nr:ROK family transcriptional regulator [Mesorhizobium xinjiangense]